MDLRPHEQRVLDQIERALRACDPKLAGMLSMFSRLTAHERLPSEDHQPAVAAARRRAARRGTPSRPGVTVPRSAMSRSGLLLVMTVMAIATVLAVSLLALAGASGSHHGSSAVCSPTWASLLACRAAAHP